MPLSDFKELVVSLNEERFYPCCYIAYVDGFLIILNLSVYGLEPFYAFRMGHEGIFHLLLKSDTSFGMIGICCLLVCGK